jgi:hypothetical protein
MSSSTTRRILSICTLLSFLILAFGTATADAKSKRDRNRDGIPDRWEKRYKLSLKKNQSNRDQDRDGVRNKCEWQAGTNPRKKDSNRDGVRDGRDDPDDDGISNRVESRLRSDCGFDDSDEEEITGKIESFEDGILSIETFDEELVVAPVSEGAVVKCGFADEEDEWYEEDPFEDGEKAGAAQYGSDHPDEEDPDFDHECTLDDLEPGRLVTGAYLEDGEFVKIRVEPPECRDDEDFE